MTMLTDTEIKKKGLKYWLKTSGIWKLKNSSAWLSKNLSIIRNGKVLCGTTKLLKR